MIARLLISVDINKRGSEIKKILASKLNLKSIGDPDLLTFKTGEKLGIAQARKIKEHFSLKPYATKGRAVVLEEADSLTDEAQNALLKTIEELPEKAVLILGADSDSNILPTILSRCKVTNLEFGTSNAETYLNKYREDLEKLLSLAVDGRFEYIEKLKERNEFLHALVLFFREQLLEDTAHEKTDPSCLSAPGRRLTKEKTEFLKELLQAEEWAKQNVNTRAILEYLMLVMPKSDL